QTLSFFLGDISPEIREETAVWLKEHAVEIREEAMTTSGYVRDPDGDFTVQCCAKEGNLTLIDLKLSVPTESAARTLAENWKQRSGEVYEAIMKILR
ncbi:MAG: DUF4364 family protein, partial [Eubacterium sp.]|nr:DUF4364 family protein [Eubacterium sp.]